MVPLLLLLSIAFFILQSVSMKFIKADTLTNKLLVNGCFTLVAGIGMGAYLLLQKPSSLHLETVLFGCLFGFLFAFTILFYNLAIHSGPLSYTAFYFSSSMLLPTVFGLVFFKETLRGTLVIALFLFLLAFYFLNVPSKKSQKDCMEGKSSKKRWLIYCFLTFLGNGSLSIIQKLHQYQLEGTEASPFMFFGFCFATLFYLMAYLLVKSVEQRTSDWQSTPLVSLLKKNFLPILFLAAGSLLGNLLLTSLAGKIPGSYLFPLVQGSIILGITLISVLFFHEKLSVRGKLGIFLGVLAIVCINL